MQRNIELFIELLQCNAHTLTELGFASGTSQEDIDDIGKITGQVIPAELKLLLAKINGQNTEDFIFLPDQTRLFSCEEIIDEWKQQQEYVNETECFYNEYQDNEKIRCTVYHKTRVPFGGQDGMGSIFIDNDPGPKGKMGQIIYLINECDFIVLADSFNELIELFLDKMQRGILNLETERDGYPNKYRLRAP